MSDLQSQKSRIRRELRQARQALSPEARADAGKAIGQHCLQLPQWSSAQRIALYLAADAEADPASLAAAARDAGKAIYLPVINDDDSLGFALWADGAALRPNRYGIPEPGADAARCPVAQLDILFLPLVGWDQCGGRLGMGGGFYDRSLQDCSGPLRVGLAYSLQEQPALPVEAWDARLDYVATEVALVTCQVKD